MLNIDTLLSKLSPKRPALPKPEDIDLKGRVVLVTGSNGSIGSEVVRCLRLSKADVVVTGRSELGLVQQPYLWTRIMDVTDRARVDSVIREFRPHIVIGCAAHKHVPILESNACEAIKNNFFGTVNVVDSCLANGVDSLVVVSTDKAIKPSSVMGASKRASEMYSLWRSGHGMNINCVRFGNVLGSSGSVLGIFEDRVARGMPIVVTHPEMDRFFMSAREAAMVAIMASQTTFTGKIHTVDLGEPVKIVDLAKAVNPGSQIAFSSVRPGEKIHEEIATGTSPFAGGLRVYEPESFTNEEIRMLCNGLGKVVNSSNDAVKAALRSYVPDYTPQ